jgi:acetate kinase
MRNGRSVDTTMGFTALDGLVMGTRCGTLDPGVVLYLLQEKGLSAQRVQDMLYRESGLLGVSGISSDMRVLLASPAPSANDAIELFVFRIARETAALAASLGGLDGFVFTAGIGEHAPEIRRMVCERLRWLGVSPEGGGTVEVRVIPTDEERMIATHTLECLAT